MTFNYKQSFIDGGRWAEYVAETLRTKGVKCSAPPIKIASNSLEIEQMTKFEKDIVFDWTDECLEVKSSSTIFPANVLDYPFKSLIVDTVSGFDAKVKKPLAYVFVSQATGEMVCVSCKSMWHWGQTTLHDKQRDIDELFYIADKGLLIPFDELVQYLIKQQ